MRASLAQVAAGRADIPISCTLRGNFAMEAFRQRLPGGRLCVPRLPRLRLPDKSRQSHGIVT